MRMIAVLGALVVIGCGGSDDRPSIKASAESICDDVAEVACFNMYKCCSEGEIEAVLGVSDPRTEEECRDDLRTQCKRSNATLEFSRERGRVAFDEDVMRDCLEALVAPDGACVTIASALPWAEACLKSAWTGTVPDGSACDYAHECGGDSYCNGRRICTALPGDGQPCGQFGCAQGTFCDPRSSPSVCHTLRSADSPCSADTQCQAGLYCDLAVTATCKPTHAVGESCNATNACGAEATCLPGTCAGSTTSCVSSAQCNGRCANSGFGCVSDSACSTGTCSNSGGQCFGPADCSVGATCVFPIKCVHDECLGPTCAERHVQADYCSGALAGLPGSR